MNKFKIGHKYYFPHKILPKIFTIIAIDLNGLHFIDSDGCFQVNSNFYNRSIPATEIAILLYG